MHCIQGVIPGLIYSGELVTVDGSVGISGGHFEGKRRGRLVHYQPQVKVELQALSALRVYWNGSWGANPQSSSTRSTTSHKLGLFWNASTRATFSFASHFSNAQNQRSQNYISGFTWRPRNDHVLKCTYNARAFPRRRLAKSHVFTLDYSIFFSLPSGRSIGGKLRGCVSDERDPRSTHQYIVCLGGRKSMVNRAGRYRFDNVPEGEYPLWLENIPQAKIESDSGMQKVRLARGKLETKDLRVTDVSQICGTLLITRDDKKIVSDDVGRLKFGEQEMSATNGFQGATVSLQEVGGTRRLAAKTDANGAFIFGRVRPGKWVVEIYKAAIPPNHQIRGSAREVITVDAGMEYALKWEIVPIKRKLKMLK